MFQQQVNINNDPIPFYCCWKENEVIASYGQHGESDLNAGKWYASVLTLDGGLFSFGVIDSEEEAADTATWAMQNNKTYDDWVGQDN